MLTVFYIDPFDLLVCYTVLSTSNFHGNETSEWLTSILLHSTPRQSLQVDRHGIPYFLHVHVFDPHGFLVDT